MKILKVKPVTVAEAFALLDERKEEATELGYEQQQAVEHAKVFSHGKAPEAEKLVAALIKERKLGAEIAAKIVDIRPQHPETLRAILVKNKIEMSDEDVEAIVKSLK